MKVRQATDSPILLYLSLYYSFLDAFKEDMSFEFLLQNTNEFVLLGIRYSTFTLSFGGLFFRSSCTKLVLTCSCDIRLVWTPDQNNQSRFSAF